MSIARRSLVSWLKSWRAECLLVAGVIALGGWFYNGQGNNPNARYNVIFSLVEPDSADSGTLHFDHLMAKESNWLNTQDWATNTAWSDHYYSNKAPGPMLVGALLYYPLYHVERALGGTPEGHRLTTLNCYLLNLALAVLPAALGALALALAARRLSGSRRLGLLVGAAGYAGTLMWPFSTQFFGHVTAAGLVAVALWQLARARRPVDYAAVGLLAGAITLTEFTGALCVLAFAVYVALDTWLTDRSQLLRRLLAYGLGGALPAAVHVAYHRLCFGVWLRPGTGYSNPAFLDSERVGGMFAFDNVPHVAWQLTFGLSRGAFVFMPILLLAIPGAVLAWRQKERRYYLLCAAICALYFLLNLSFNGWHAGGSAGPRYLIIALPAAMLLTVPTLMHLLALPTAPRRRGLAVVALLLAISAANMSVTAAVSPSYGAIDGIPLRDSYRSAVVGNMRTPYQLPPTRLGGDWQVALLDPSSPTELDALPWREVTDRHGRVDLAALYPDAPTGSVAMVRCLLFIDADDDALLYLRAAGDVRARLNHADLPRPAGSDTRRFVAPLAGGANHLLIASARTGPAWDLWFQAQHERLQYIICPVSPSVGRDHDQLGLHLGEAVGLPRKASFLAMLSAALLWAIGLLRLSRDPVT